MLRESALIKVLQKKLDLKLSKTGHRDPTPPEEREVELENIVAYVVNRRFVTDWDVAKALGSRVETVRGMVKRANERNIALMRGENNA